MPKGDGRTYQERFWLKVNKRSGTFATINGTSSECWNWVAGVNGRGYGYFWMNGKTNPAYRIAYEFECGPIPDGLELDHLCRNPLCVRPSHLEAVTAGVNQLRGDGTIAATNSRKTHCPSGHEYDARNTRLVYGRTGGQKRVCRACQRAWRKLHAHDNLDVKNERRRLQYRAKTKGETDAVR